MASYISEMVQDAIQAHDDGCCSESSPCSTRIKLSRNHSISGTGFGHELPAPRFGSGHRTGHGSRKAEPVWATDNQVGYLLKLIAERDMLSLLPADRDLCAHVKADGKIQKSAASKLIDALKVTAYATSVSTNGFQKDVAPQAKATAKAAVEIGLYRNADGVIIKAYKARLHDGILAARLDVTGDKPWAYLGRADRFVTADFERMTLEQAMEFGKVGIGGKFYCCQCGIELTDPNSQDEGIGPVCAKRF